MGLYENAIKIALSLKDLKMAKDYTRKIIKNPNLKKKMWLKILSSTKKPNE